MTPEQVAQAQLDAYNARDIDAFLAAYDDRVELARLPGGEVFARGHGEMRRIYADLFEKSPDLHCRLVQRMCHDRFVVDYEDVTGVLGTDKIGAVAIYEVVDDRILRAWFLK